MQKVFNVYKPLGKTPLEAVSQLRKIFPELIETKIAYAGRLDPMAEGVLLLLIGDECKKRKSYEGLDKVYEFEAVFGLTSDTYDVLGIVKFGKSVAKEKLSDSLQAKIGQFIGKGLQKYPPYSSVRVQGKSLFYYARKNKLKQIKIPEKEIEIYHFKLKLLSELDNQKLFEKVCGKIQKVKGDFRQKDSLRSWKGVLNKNGFYPVASMRLKCASGTYVRSLVHDLGREIGTGALTLSIKRTNVGRYKLKNSLKLF